MDTVDTYCLLPQHHDLIGTLERLFLFGVEVYHDGVEKHLIHSAEEAAATFSGLMRGGEFIRLQESRIENTEGGWLYRLQDGAAVIGISGDASIPGHVFERVLASAVPGAPCITRGDAPPPMTRRKFETAVASRDSDDLRH